ncbi:hypothetical protein HPB50_020319 [Hyalomma asiaticum]|uniref:Uncharacterized protein n=1 Tax=Hyalomma asiaticum TaxID=266040 RepID=A0ACB7RPX3_HYAAI|nr:hypothetical protein HPB50_020319 [Hyalomma asiaticum]
MVRNILLLSTLLKSIAFAYAAIQKIHTKVGASKVSDYVAAPENTFKGIIRNHSTEESTLRSIIVKQRNPTAIEVKGIKNTHFVVILFDWLRVPKNLTCGTALLPCSQQEASRRLPRLRPGRAPGRRVPPQQGEKRQRQNRCEKEANPDEASEPGDKQREVAESSIPKRCFQFTGRSQSRERPRSRGRSRSSSRRPGLTPSGVTMSAQMTWADMVDNSDAPTTSRQGKAQPEHMADPRMHALERENKTLKQELPALRATLARLEGLTLNNRPTPIPQSSGTAVAAVCIQSDDEPSDVDHVMSELSEAPSNASASGSTIFQDLAVGLSGSEWSLLKNLFGDSNKPTKSNARIMIERLIHLHTNEGTSPRDFADALADIYLPVESKSFRWVDPTRE